MEARSGDGLRAGGGGEMGRTEELVARGEDNENRLLGRHDEGVGT